MIKIGNSPVSDIKLGDSDVRGVMKDGHVLWERDQTEILVTFSSNATAADCYYRKDSTDILCPELYDEQTKSALFKFPSDQNLISAFRLNNAIDKIEIKKLGSVVSDIRMISVNNSVKDFKISGCSSTVLKNCSGLCYFCSQLASFSMEDCYFPNAKCIALTNLSKNITQISIRNIQFSETENFPMFDSTCDGFTKLKGLTLENIDGNTECYRCYNTFKNCSSIEKIDLSKFGSYTKRFEFSKDAFTGCSSLTEIILNDGRTNWCPFANKDSNGNYSSIDDINLSDCKLSYSSLNSFLQRGIRNSKYNRSNTIYIPESFSDDQVRVMQATCKVGTLVKGAPPA